MSDRYSMLFALPPNLYSERAPVLVAAGALLKDNRSGKVLAQLKIQNIQDNAIKAATVKIMPLDTVGAPLGSETEHQYLDLNIARDMDFGQNAPIPLPDPATRAFSVSIAEVIFMDNSIWTDSEAPWEELTPPVLLEQALEEKELAKQYKIKYGADCKYLYKKEKDLWMCVCKAVNHNSETTCHRCGKRADILAALNITQLKAERDERLERERIAAEKSAAEKKKKLKKTKKITLMVTLMVTLIVVTAAIIGVLIKYQQEEAARAELYNNAIALAEDGHYDNAIDAFTKLGNYKDSPQQMEAAKLAAEYDRAVSLLDKQSTHGKARAIFEELGDYKDAKTYLEGFSMRLVKKTFTNLDTSYSVPSTYYYNESGDLVSEVDYLGSSTYEYSADKTTVTKHLDGSSSVSSYDQQGNLVQQSYRNRNGDIDNTSTYMYEYGENNVITKIKRTSKEGESVTTYEYDDKERIIRANITRQVYHIRKVFTQTYNYDQDGYLISIESEDTNIHYHYDWVYTPSVLTNEKTNSLSQKGFPKEVTLIY